MTDPRPPRPPAAAAALRLDRVIREHCEVVLGMTNGHVREAAKILGCGWTSLYRWIAQWKEEDSRKEAEREARKRSRAKENHVSE